MYKAEMIAELENARPDDTAHINSEDPEWEGVTIVGKPKDLLRLIHSGKLSIFEKEDK